MQYLPFASFFSLVVVSALQADESFDRDRAAILAMAGTFQVEFTFQETIALRPEYKVHKPYHTEALELVKVAEDSGDSITLQHLLIVEDIDGPTVIKHWAQIWNYEDTHTLSFEGNSTWLPVTLSSGEVAGTWTQLVTQVDDSPRYKAAGRWEHSGDFSEWTSFPSTRPLPRREYTKRSDYDRLEGINRHLITPDGWVHLQDNRKHVRRESQNHFLCLESGTNRYTRITHEGDSDSAEGVAMAEKYWAATHPFWKDVRQTWVRILTTSQGPVRYQGRLEDEKKNLMAKMGALAEDFQKDPSIALPQIESLLSEHLR